MTAIFELHIRLPRTPPTKMTKSPNLAFVLLCLDLSSAATVYVIFEMEKLRSPHSPSVSVIRRFAAIELSVLNRLCPSLASQAVIVFLC